MQAAKVGGNTRFFLISHLSLFSVFQKRTGTVSVHTPELGEHNYTLRAPGCGIQVKMCLCPPKTWHSLQVKPTQTQKGCSVTCFHLAAGSFLLRKRNFLHPFHRVKPNSWNTELNERGSWVCTESPAQSWSHTWLPAFFQSQGSPAPFLPLEKSV